MKDETFRLQAKPRRMNLIVCKKDSDAPTNFERLRAFWPGAIYEFSPEPPKRIDGRISADVKALCDCLLMAAGRSPLAAGTGLEISPLKLLRWSKEACSQFAAASSTSLAKVLSDTGNNAFRGSCEGSVSLAIKAQLATWIRQQNPSAQIHFEETIEADAQGSGTDSCRVDVNVEGTGRFEIESLRGSGPVEVFYQSKVFSRVSANDDPFWLVVPSEAILWFGPYLADIAAKLEESRDSQKKRGHVVVVGNCGGYLRLEGRPLAPVFDSEVPFEMMGFDSVAPRVGFAESSITLKDVKLEPAILEAVRELVIWPEKHGRKFNRQSRSSGILFFGPPGCGKSRLAKAIAGELDQEVRILSPSDLRGPYIGWGQIMIREQFDWLAENSGRMIIIDELDAVARSRRQPDNMHSDEKADVNELLVQMDRVLAMRRVLVATTNYIGSIDDAALRSGRFGRFIPVPPPDLDEAVEIIMYYLRQLVVGPTDESGIRVIIPELEEVRGALARTLEENRKQGKFFCGADLEEVVNRAYNRAARAAQASGDPEVVNINVTISGLNDSLNEVPRSIQRKAIRAFLKDVRMYCNQVVWTRLNERFSKQSE